MVNDNQKKSGNQQSQHNVDEQIATHAKLLTPPGTNVRRRRWPSQSYRQTSVQRQPRRRRRQSSRLRRRRQSRRPQSNGTSDATPSPLPSSLPLSRTSPGPVSDFYFVGGKRQSENQAYVNITSNYTYATHSDALRLNHRAPRHRLSPMLLRVEPRRRRGRRHAWGKLHNL